MPEQPKAPEGQDSLHMIKSRTADAERVRQIEAEKAATRQQQQQVSRQTDSSQKDLKK